MREHQKSRSWLENPRFTGVMTLLFMIGAISGFTNLIIDGPSIRWLFSLSFDILIMWFFAYHFIDGLILEIKSDK